MAQSQTAQDDVALLLEGAAGVTARIRNCWLITDSEEGGNTARPMGRVRPAKDDDLWTIRFVTNSQSQKALEIKRSRRVELIFQDDADEAFVVLAGEASVLADPFAIQRLWKDAYQVYFPSAEERANATFIEIKVQRMRLWIRGVTPEPFGLHPAVLERDADGNWSLQKLMRACRPQRGSPSFGTQ
jgi:general stress protein 26